MSEAAQMRNFLRPNIRRIAADLTSGAISVTDAVRQLEALAETDEADLAADEIVIDDDLSGALGPLLGALGPKPAAADHSDPVEAAMAKAITARDRIQALKIAGEIPSEADIFAYADTLRILRQVLNEK